MEKRCSGYNVFFAQSQMSQITEWQLDGDSEMTARTKKKKEWRKNEL